MRFSTKTKRLSRRKTPSKNSRLEDVKSECRWCGLTHSGRCPLVEALEYYEDGKLKRVEFQKVDKLQPIGPNDVLILRTELMLDKDQTLHLRNRFDEQLPAHFRGRTIILTCGLEPRVLEAKDVT